LFKKRYQRFYQKPFTHLNHLLKLDWQNEALGIFSCIFYIFSIKEYRQTIASGMPPEVYILHQSQFFFHEFSGINRTETAFRQLTFNLAKKIFEANGILLISIFADGHINRDGGPTVFLEQVS
ncbi:MAG: hypothetical protein GVY02_00105, partial [Bacteroidetes bacterium]|nr:hypothetical protein [Bacteroidota bacterium]